MGGKGGENCILYTDAERTGMSGMSSVHCFSPFFIRRIKKEKG